jgi:hypothetical protein
VATRVSATLLLRNVTAAQFSASDAPRAAFVTALAGALSIAAGGVNVTGVADVPLPPAPPPPAARRALRQSSGNSTALAVSVDITAPSAAAATTLTANVTALASGAGAAAFVVALNKALSAVGITVASLSLAPPPPPPAPPPPAPPPPPSPPAAAASSSGGGSGGAAAGAVIGILLGIPLLCYGVYRYALWRPDSRFSQAVLEAAAVFEATARDVASSFMAQPPVVWLQQKLRGGDADAAGSPVKAPGGGADPFGAAPAFAKKGGGGGGGGGGGASTGPPESHSRAEVATAQLLRHNNKTLFKHLFGGKGAPGSPWASLTGAPPLRGRDVVAVAGELSDVKGRTLYAKLVTLAAAFAESGAPKPCDVSWEEATAELSEAARALVAAAFFVYLLAVNDETPYFEELAAKLAKTPALAAKAEAAREKCERLDMHALGDCLARLASVRGEADAAEFAADYGALLRTLGGGGGGGGSARAAPASFRDELTGDEFETPLPLTKRSSKSRAPMSLPPPDRSSFENSDASTLGSPRGGGVGGTRRAQLVGLAADTEEEEAPPPRRSTNKKKKRRASSAQKSM